MEKKDEYSFVEETIKKRPLNKQKIFRKTLITASSAVIFGLIACVTFSLLEPVISNWISPEEITKVVFPEEETEKAPEELLTEENVAKDTEETKKQQIANQLVTNAGDAKIALQSYQTLYDELYAIATNASKSIVTVTGVSQETDWFQNEVENRNETSGVIVAATNLQRYVLADINGLPDAEKYTVTLGNGNTAEAELKRKDKNTGLAIFIIYNTSFREEDWAVTEVAELGNSRSPNIVGRPIIAIGSPLGQRGSICYGIVTSNKDALYYADHSYSILTTDMTGSETNASGVLINTLGEVIGVFSNESIKSMSGALLASFGISDLKSLIEEMSNGERRLYLGIHGNEVTDIIHEQSKIPNGLYVSEVDAGSPAMESGILNGDVITRLNGKIITSEKSYQDVLTELHIDLSVVVVVKRFNGTKYIEIESEIKPEELK